MTLASLSVLDVRLLVINLLKHVFLMQTYLVLMLFSKHLTPIELKELNIINLLYIFISRIVR